MSFKSIGNIDVTVTDAYIAEAHWEAKAGEVNNKGLPVIVWGDVCLVIEDKDGNNDIWRGELSNRSGSGTRAHQEQTEITLEKLVSIGFNTPTFNDFIVQCDENNSIPNLIGFECTVTTEEREFEGRDGKPRKAVFVKYINARGSGGPKRLSKADFLARVNAQSAPQSAPVPDTATAPGYPPPAPPTYPAAPTAQYPKTAPAPATAPGYPPQTLQGRPAGQPPRCPY